MILSWGGSIRKGRDRSETMEKERGIGKEMSPEKNEMEGSEDYGDWE